MRAVAAAILLAVTVAGPAAAQGRRPIDADRFLELPQVGDPQLSPDGRAVAYTVTTPSLQENRNVSRVWLVGTDGAPARQLTTAPGNERAPRWSPDGQRLAFISPREEGQQVWQVRADGGAPVRITDIPTGVSDYVWARDGRALYVVTDLPWPATGDEAARRSGDFPTEARIWTGLFYRHWNEWRAGVRQHDRRRDSPHAMTPPPRTRSPS